LSRCNAFLRMRTRAQRVYCSSRRSFIFRSYWGFVLTNHEHDFCDNTSDAVGSASFGGDADSHPAGDAALLLWLRNVEVAALRQRTVLPTARCVFSVRESERTTVWLAQLAGKIWIADFIYTTCPGRVDDQQPDKRTAKPLEKTDVHLVSFSVIRRETRQTFCTATRRIAAEPGRWDFSRTKSAFTSFHMTASNLRYLM